MDLIIKLGYLLLLLPINKIKKVLVQEVDDIQDPGTSKYSGITTLLCAVCAYCFEME